MERGHRILIPYVGMERVIECLKVMYRRGVREIDTKELSTILGCGLSNLNNITPTLSLLGLAEVKNGKIAITSNGMELIRALNVGEIEGAREIIRKGVEQSEALQFVRSLLEARGQLTGEEIGRALADRFGKRWKTIASYRTYGNSCASIISFAGFGIYRDGVLSLKSLTPQIKIGLYAPEIGFKSIIRLLKELYSTKKSRVPDLARKLSVKESRVSSEISVCVLLGLVSKDATGVYQITEAGSKLIDPLLPEEEKAIVFRECLLSSPYGDLILKIAEKKKELTYEDFGEGLAYFLNRNWTALTKKLYGKKFVSWLSAAGLIEKVSPNKFKFKEVELKKELAARKEYEKHIEPSVVYEIGRILGILETITPNEEARKDFEDKVSMLKSLLKDHIDISAMLDMLKTNFQLALETGSPEIYRHNVEFVGRKIREKLGIPF
ncbi:AAA-associated domain-containing protein [Candidatus Bathyarchaeota archaeon]|nr:AAA-associated domain-containing protein [Candidatus Bathyarchaeota archaeon]